MSASLDLDPDISSYFQFSTEEKSVRFIGSITHGLPSSTNLAKNEELRQTYDDQINRHAEHVLRHAPPCHICNSPCRRLITLINTPVLIPVSRIPREQSCSVIFLYLY
jgi:hypothetical protein